MPDPCPGPGHKAAGLFYVQGFTDDSEFVPIGFFSRDHPCLFRIVPDHPSFSGVDLNPSESFWIILPYFGVDLNPSGSSFLISGLISILPDHPGLFRIIFFAQTQQIPGVTGYPVLHLPQRKKSRALLPQGWMRRILPPPGKSWSGRLPRGNFPCG